MGYLGSDALTVQLWVDKYNLKTLVETGLEQGRSMAWATTTLSGIEKFVAIEIDYKWIEAAGKIGLMVHDPAPGAPERKMLDDNIYLIHGESADKIPEAIEISEGNILWWLDAHVPKKGARFEQDKAATMEELLHKDVAFPLERELGAIKAQRNISGDVFIIDDMRLYDKQGTMNFYTKRGYDHPGTSEFIMSELESTHTIVKIHKDSIYLIALPKS